MKRIVLVLLTFCLLQITYSQTNTFPATGPVYIGSSLSLDGSLQFGSSGNIHLGSNSQLFNSDGFNLINWNSGGLKIGEEGYDYYLNIYGFGSKVTFNDTGIEYHSSGRHLFFGGGLEVYSEMSLLGNLTLSNGNGIWDTNMGRLFGFNEGILKIGNNTSNIPIDILGFGDSKISFGNGHVFYNAAGFAEYNATYHNFATGNVGIGTTTPTAKLDVNGDVSLTGNLKIDNYLLNHNNVHLIGWNNNAIQIGYYGNDVPVDIYGFGLSSINFGDGYVTYNTAGDATYNATNHNFSGIVSMNSDLGVDGDINITSGHSFMINGMPISGSSQWTVLGNNIYNNNSGNMGLGTTEPHKKLHLYSDGEDCVLRLEQNSSSNIWDIKANASNGGLDFAYNEAAAPFVTFSGNGSMGIGVSAPLNKLQLDAGNATACYNQFTVGTTTGQTATDGTLFGADATGNKIIKQQENLPLLFFTNNIERLRVSSTGYVGIGTLTPAYKLDVSGDINISSGSSFRIGGVAISGSQWLTSSNNISYNSGNVGIGVSIPQHTLELSGEAFFSVGEDFDAFTIQNGPSGKNAFRYDGDLNLLFLQENGGNVGIGTSNPIANLQIGEGTANGLLNLGGYSFAGSLRSSGELFMGYNVYAKYSSSLENGVIRAHSSNGTGYSAVQFGNNGDINFYQSSDPQSFQYDDQINFVPTIAFKGNGNVGIGTATPTAKLDVNGSGKFNGNFYVLNGNVGIGTTNPTTKLAVNGSIKTKEVIITLDGWSDFVFHSSYKLRTLGEVEKFIKTNNHLPEIPSETEVKENGISVGEMNAKLLQKIEELTLYVIDLQKQVNELKSKK